ncbi:MAG: Fe-Mn family superoxide dismutase [Minisyncoccia bacterium]
MNYTIKTFDTPRLEGISEKQVKVHLGLYEGYVKHVNLIMEKLSAVRAGQVEPASPEMSSRGGLDPYLVAELRRRFAFEFDGMRLHEQYFEQFEGGLTSLTSGGMFEKIIVEKYGSTSLTTGGDALVAHIKEVAGTRGVGWVVVYADPRAKTLHTVFVGDHEIGQLAGLPIILALDLWEHAYMVDYVPAEKKNYVDAFFANINWGVIEKRFDEAMAMSVA